MDNKLVLKVEDELLLRCARSKLEQEDEDRISSFLDNNLDWDYLLDKAARNRLRPLLYLNLNRVGAEKVPRDVLQGLKEFFKSNGRRNLLLTSELVKVMDLLENEGVQAVTYKGPVLAQGAYGNLAYREFGDIDVFIDKKDAIKVIKLMAKINYDLYPSINIDDSFYLRFVTEHRFINKKNGALVEIKWKIEGDFFTFHENPSILTDYIRKIDLNGLKLNNFSPENQLLILCIHASKHDWSRISWIVDIAEYIKENNMRWDYCIDTSEKLGFKKILLINLYLTNDIIRLKLPEEVIKQIHSNFTVKKRADNIKKRFYNDYDLNIVGKLYSNLNKRDNIVYGIKDSLNGLTKPGLKDFTDFPLPESYFIFYYLLRPFLLLKRYGTTPIN